MPAEFAHPLPDDFPLTSGALIEPLAVALHAVRRGGVTAGDRVLVTGAGPIGLLVLQAARAVGAGETVVTDINPGRLAHARRLGADRVLETSREPLPQEPLFDIALDCSGVEAALAAAAHAVRPGGSLVAVGNPPQPRTALPLAWMQRQELSLVTAFRYAGEFPAAVSLAATGRDDAVHRRRGRPAPHRGPRDPRRGRRAAFPAQAQEPQLPGPLQLHRHSAPGGTLRPLRDPDAAGLDDDEDGAEQERRRAAWRVSAGLLDRWKRSGPSQEEPGCRSRRGTGVARSSGVSLAEAYPQVAAMWLQERNGGLTPEKATPKMQVAMWWRCAAGHEWQENISTRTTLPKWKNGDVAACRECVGYKVSYAYPDCGHIAMVTPEAAAKKQGLAGEPGPLGSDPSPAPLGRNADPVDGMVRNAADSGADGVLPRAPGDRTEGRRGGPAPLVVRGNARHRPVRRPVHRGRAERHPAHEERRGGHRAPLGGPGCPLSEPRRGRRAVGRLIPAG
ncbi:hypothetical protein SVIO_098310 [Streptomyces violaceusniger]|uniref:Alcohol dehydrogenase-like C-terminal domain-containing protein n=1 Tax=Streptomyces violaceusniger TaxID=68280 RepID=A0A4D4LL89_STRVO|nr:hypothetical protein SVIO_098310 [Streptomyces violaceusniger]